MGKDTRQMMPEATSPVQEGQKPVEDDGVGVVEAARLDAVSEIPETGNFSYVAIKTGRILQGGGIHTDHYYASIAQDTPRPIRDRYEAMFRSLGFERVSGVSCTALANADIWRVGRSKWKKICEGKAKRNRERDAAKPPTPEMLQMIRQSGMQDTLVSEEYRTRPFVDA